MALPVMPRPRISAGFKTPRPMGAPKLAMPKPPTMPKAGRLSPTGGRIGGMPSPKAPRIPAPVVPKVPTAKSDVSKNVPRALRGPEMDAWRMTDHGRLPYPDYRLAARNEGRRAAREIAQGKDSKARWGGKSNPLSRLHGDFAGSNIASGRRYRMESRSDLEEMSRPKPAPKQKLPKPTLSRSFTLLRERMPHVFKAAVPNVPSAKGLTMAEHDYIIEKAFRMPSPQTRRKIKRGVLRVAQEMDPKRNQGLALNSRLGIANPGEGGIALGLNRTGNLQEMARGVRGLFGKNAYGRVTSRALDSGARLSRRAGDAAIAHRAGRAGKGTLQPWEREAVTSVRMMRRRPGGMFQSTGKIKQVNPELVARRQAAVARNKASIDSRPAWGAPPGAPLYRR